MSRIRLAVLLLAVVLLGGIGLLVERAFDLESDGQYDRHERFAERVFDEIDDSLNALLNAEEARSFHQYRYLYVPEGAVAADRAWTRSELSQDPSAAYILGWFQYDAQGQFRSPLRPEVDERAILPSRWRATEQIEATEAQLRTLTAGLQSLPDFPKPPPVVATVQVVRTDAPPEVRQRTISRTKPEKDEVQEPFREVEDGKASLPITSQEPRRPVLLPPSKTKEQLPEPVPKTAGKTKKRSEDRKGSSKSLNKAAGRRSGRAPRQAKTSAANVYGFKQQSEIVEELEPESLRTAREELDAEDAAVAELAAEISPREQAAFSEMDAAVAPAEESASAATEAPEITNEQAIADLWADGDERQQRVAENLDALDEEVLEAETLDEELYDDPEWAEWVKSERNAAKDVDADQRPSAMERKLDDARRKRVAWKAAKAKEEGLVLVPAPEPQRADMNASLDLGPSDVRAVKTGRIAGGGVEVSRAPTTVEELAALPSVAAPNVAAQRRGPASNLLAGPAEVQPPPSVLPSGVDGDLTVTISQLKGLAVEGEHLVLYRRVSAGAQTFLQGVVLKLPELARHLEREVVAGTELAGYVSFVWGAGATAPGNYAFDHVFAAPFEALAATALLEPVPREDQGPLPFLLGVTLLLVLATSAGLFSLYRMVAVVVRFAEQRNNFVSAVSHELKTPLTAIRMYSEMLRDDIVPNEAKRYEYYRTITAESERLSRLINNVLELAKLEKGTRTVSLSMGLLQPVLAEAVLVLGPHARSRGFELDLVADDDLPPVSFEHDALLQVLINLVDNSLKFSATAAVKRVVLEAKRDPGGGVVIRVRDQGPGVPSGQITRIFQPFFRGERELTRSTKGTGIGLALVQGLIECMGGSVTARNHPRGGFEVEIGLVPATV